MAGDRELFSVQCLNVAAACRANNRIQALIEGPVCVQAMRTEFERPRSDESMQTCGAHPDADLPEADIIAPPRANAVPSETAKTASTQRDRHLQHITEYGRMVGQTACGGNKRAQAETTMARFKQVIGCARARTSVERPR